MFPLGLDEDDDDDDVDVEEDEEEDEKGEKEEEEEDEEWARGAMFLPLVTWAQEILKPASPEASEDVVNLFRAKQCNIED